MTITLNLTPETEAKLRALAAQGNADAIRQLLAEAMTPAVESLLKEIPPESLSNEEFEAIADEMADLVSSAGAPALSDYAVSRAGIYEGHPKL